MIGAGYTWGIGGPLFLLVYIVLAVAVGTAGTRVRRALADVPVTRPVGDLAAHPYDVAYLNGGRQLAVTAALGAMYRAGTISPAGHGRVVAAERPDHRAHELERAIHHAAAVPAARHALPAVDAVRSALDRIDSRLVEAGLLLDAERRCRIRAVAGRTLALAGLGILRVVSGLAANRPVGYLVVALLVVVALAVVQWRRVPRRSRAGDAVLADLAQQHHALSPRCGRTGRSTGPREPRWPSACSGSARCGPRNPRSPPTSPWRGRARAAGPAGRSGAVTAGRPGAATRAGRAAARAAAAVGVGAVAAAAAGADRGFRGRAGDTARDRPKESTVHGRVDGSPLGGGVGIGWRPEIAGAVGDLSGLRFCEVIAEALAGGGHGPAAPPRGVAELRERGVAVVPHGVHLSLGGAEPLDPARVTHLAACAAAVGAPLVSEHVAFVRAGGREAGHLLPVPRSREALDVLTAHVRAVQAELDVPLALEPIAALFDWPDDEYTEGGFLTALLERTGALLLLDVANVYANAVNRGTDPEALLDAVPLDRVAYVHVAGGAEHPADPGVYHDTHTDPVPPAVLALLERLCERLDTPPAVMLERDGRYPPAAQLHAELDAIAAAAALSRATP